MAVYAFDLRSKTLLPLPTTSLEDLKVREPRELQESIAKNIQVLGDDLLVLGVEVSLWDNSRRRIDILCIDRNCRPVVIELKRGETDDSDLQALRYAALISTVSMRRLIHTRARYRHGDPVSDAAVEEAYRDVIAHGTGEDGNRTLSADAIDALSTSQARIILLAEDFGAELATTAMWLSEQHEVDITLHGFTAYQSQGTTLLDIRQVLPVPRTEEYLVRERQEAARQRAVVGERDYTRYDFIGKTNLPKNRLVLEVVRWYQDSHPKALWADILRVFPTDLQGSHGVVRELGDATSRQGKDPTHRYFFDDVLTASDGVRYVVSRMWSKDNLALFVSAAQKLGASVSVSA